MTAIPRDMIAHAPANTPRLRAEGWVEVASSLSPSTISEFRARILSDVIRSKENATHPVILASDRTS